MTTTHEIPPLAEKPMMWPQPNPSAIDIDADTAIMTQATLDELVDCTGTRPGNLCVGMMWKTQLGKYWYLWWVQDMKMPGDDAGLMYRKVLIV